MKSTNVKLKKMRLKTGDPEMAREINRALILHLMRNCETISRTEIARQLNLSKVTVSTIINDLIKSGYVLEIGEGSSMVKGGRRPIMLSLNTSSKYVIGVDLGTTNMVAAMGDIRGRVLKKIRIPTSRNHNVEDITDQVSNLVDEIINETKLDRSRIVGLGLAVAGQVEKDQGVIIFSPHFDWHNVAIAKLIREKTGLLTTADNCTRVMTIGEVWFGEGRNTSNLIFINVGHGIGSALVIDGKIYNHHSEFGHILITKKRIRCACGKYGCLEVVASGEAIEREANKLMPIYNDEWITAKMVAERALRGDEIAKKIYHEAGRYLGRGISILANTLNPEKIVIGGGVSGAGELLLNPILEEFNKNTMDVVKQRTKVCLSSLGMDAGVLGAIAVAMNDLIFDYDLVSRQYVSIKSDM
jgi:glucokinase-like ROK family protein